MRQSPFKRKPPKAKKCRFCKEQFQPYNSNQVCCNPNCALSYARQKQANDSQKAIKARERQHRAETRRRKEAVKTRAQWVKEAQQAFNAYIRERDYYLPCISCGTYNPGGDPRGGIWDCSHYRSVGAMPALRFEEYNAHKGCKHCNRDKSGNIVEYRIGLADRIGPDIINWLEGPHEPKKYTIDDLKEIKAKYSKKARELKKERELSPHGG